ncbi:hypothetical protein SteCoe_4818 [Stentor coeruleus]|uniref:Calmodulin n=1 Tax=Stentor coeruleus TaxID=5963 RepID=A0A1R2CU29_9CILI|nr:hypothetical protein SteCoe_4818 [Stentor coeruleus]
MILNEDQISKCKSIFSQFDKDGTGRIDRFELRVVLERKSYIEMGQKPTEEELFSMINEVDENNTGKIEFYEFLKVYEKNQKAHDRDDEEDLIDAFVAMGGNKDKSGIIDTEKLINVIRHQFEMTIDIEKLIEEIDEDQNHTIDFDEFKRLLSSNY